MGECQIEMLYVDMTIIDCYNSTINIVKKAMDFMEEI